MRSGWSDAPADCMERLPQRQYVNLSRGCRVAAGACYLMTSRESAMFLELLGCIFRFHAAKVRWRGRASMPLYRMTEPMTESARTGERCLRKRTGSNLMRAIAGWSHAESETSRYECASYCAAVQPFDAAEAELHSLQDPRGIFAWYSRRG